jgi:hypothetical protein
MRVTEPDLRPHGRGPVPAALCSGLIQHAYAVAGANLLRTTCPKCVVRVRSRTPQLRSSPKGIPSRCESLATAVGSGASTSSGTNSSHGSAQSGTASSTDQSARRDWGGINELDVRFRQPEVSTAAENRLWHGS